MTERDRRILEKICAEIDTAIEIFEERSIEDFLSNDLIKRAECMTLICIGELVKGLNDDTRTQYPQVLWKKIAGMRDIAAHKYGTLSMEDVYEVLSKDLPTLKIQLSEILKD